MSLLKWQEIAKSKSALGNKINFVHNAVTQKKLGEETSHAEYEKMLKPVTSKLDNLAPNFILPPAPPPQKKPARKKVKLKKIDYYPEVDPFEEMDVEGLFDDDEAVSPEAEKQIHSPSQISADPPTYEEIMQEVGDDDDPPEYEENDDNFSGYTMKSYDEEEEEEAIEMLNEHLADLNILSYTTVEAVLGSSNMSATRKRNFLEKSVIPVANHRRNQLKGYKASIAKKFKKGKITEEVKNLEEQRIDGSFQILNEYIKHYKRKTKQMGSGLKRKKGGAISFFSNPKDLLQKLEVIIGSIVAGNTNVDIKNTGVGILDFLLKEGVINKFQHEKIFRSYFKF